MAKFSFSDAYDQKAFGFLAQEKIDKSSAIIQSGLAVHDGFLQSKVDASSKTVDISQFKPLGNDEPNTSDDSGNLAVSKKITKGLQVARISNLNQHWSVSSFTRDITKDDPVGAITTSIAKYWSLHYQRRLIASLLGIKKDNVANDSGDMVKAPAKIDDNSSVADAERISANLTLDAKQTLGDFAGSLDIVIMPSLIRTRLQKQGLIQPYANEIAGTKILRYLDWEVVECDDALLFESGTYRTKYNVIFAGRGAIGYASAGVGVPFEQYRVAETGNGGGEDKIASRVAPVLHPWGFRWLEHTVTEECPVIDDLKLPDNWDRIWERKNIPLAFLEVNE